jgi:hypothetical protein
MCASFASFEGGGKLAIWGSIGSVQNINTVQLAGIRPGDRRVSLSRLLDHEAGPASDSCDFLPQIMHCRLPVDTLDSPHGTSGSSQSWSYRLHCLPGACGGLEQLPHCALSQESSDPQRPTVGVDERRAVKVNPPSPWGYRPSSLSCPHTSVVGCIPLFRSLGEPSFCRNEA